MLQVIQNPPHKRLQLFGHYLMVIKVWMIAAAFGFHGLEAEDLDVLFARVYFTAFGLHPFQHGKK